MVKNYLHFSIVISLLFLTVVVSMPGHTATIEATTDRMTVQENESISLTFSSDSDVDDDPDFSPLETTSMFHKRSLFFRSQHGHGSILISAGLRIKALFALIREAALVGPFEKTAHKTR